MADSNNLGSYLQPGRELSENGPSESSPPPSARPYRSHRVPACQFCRRRKSRCTRDLVHRPCILCRTHGVSCSSLNDVQEKSTDGSWTPIKKRKRPEAHHGHQAAPVQETGVSMDPSGPEAPRNPNKVTKHLPVATQLSHIRSPLQSTSQEQPKQSGHIIGPALARDAQVLERYMLPVYNTVMSHARPNPYSVYSDDPRNPVVYMQGPRQRGVLPIGNGTSAFRQFETMEKILDPLGPDLFQTYFIRIHPAFPILDEKTVVEAYRQDGLPYALVCEIYAVSLLSWTTSAKLMASRSQPPDLRYMWNLAVSALNEDFLSPSFSTVLNCILDILGRPITSITYNAINIGRCVALSLSLGLNRNPSSWSLDQRQKSLRIRTWWGLLIHDTWASLSHGTPKHINRAEWDVPLPDFDSLSISAIANRSEVTDDRLEGARSFIALCRLTEILGEVLPLIYALHIRKEISCLKALRRVEASLDEWEDSLPEWLDLNRSEFQRNASGALNLQLSFLAVKMCICRIALQEAGQSDESDETEVLHYYQSRCRKAAQAVINFVISLRTSETTVFWLPYSAYHFTSAATLILRCALEAENDERAQECVNSASSLLDRLRQLKEEANWDLSDMCIDQCGDIIERMLDGDYLDFRRRNPPAARPKPNPSDRIPGVSTQSGSHTMVLTANNVMERNSTKPLVIDQSSGENAGETRAGIDAPEHGTISNSGMLSSGFYNPSPVDQGYQIDPDNAPFPDIWQMPHMDGYTQF